MIGQAFYARKRSLLGFTLLLPALVVQAQQEPTSRVVPFSGRMPGQPDGSVTLRLRLFAGPTGGQPCFEETQGVSVAAETFFAFIGDATTRGIPTTSCFPNTDSLWIGFAMDSTPDQEIGARTAITSAGYAHFAPIAGDAMLLSGLSSTAFARVGAPNTFAANQTINGNLNTNGLASAVTINSTTQYNLGGDRVLSIAGTGNLFAGVGAGDAQAGGSGNTFVGASAGQSNATGNGNSFFGYRAGQANLISYGNAFFGAEAGRYSRGNNNAFIGAYAGNFNTRGGGNTFVGTFAGQVNTLGDGNSFLGAQAGGANTTGSSNTFVGVSAGGNNTTSSNNSFFGSVAGYSNTGEGNSFFGSGAGQSNTTGSNNTYVGGGAGGSPGLTNATAIGAGATVQQSNSLVLGNGVNVGIGTSSPIAKLHVNGALRLENGFSHGGTGEINVDAFGVPGGRLKILDNGNVGIGQPSPDQKLTVAGSIKSTSGGFVFPDGTVQQSAAGLAGGLPAPQLAMLRWDLFRGYGTFPVGSNPWGIAFDGINIWVTNYGSNNVTKLRASDGANLGTFPVGPNPRGVAFDGINIWVTNSGAANVTKLRASDGANLGTFPVGPNPWGVAFDGTYIWVANSRSNNVTKLRTSDGADLGAFAVGTEPHGIAFDGANIWVANAVSNDVTKLRASDGASLATTNVCVNPEAVAFDGYRIWVSCRSGNAVWVLLTDGSIRRGLQMAGGPTGVAFDGANIWVARTDSGIVHKLQAWTESEQLGEILYSGLDSPVGVAFDGASIWVTNSNTGTVLKFPARQR